MDAVQSPYDGFDPEELQQISAAFDGIWESVAANLPNRDSSRDDELKLLISIKLFALAKIGIRNRDLLHQLIWQTNPLNAMHNEKANDIVLTVSSGEIIVTKPGTDFLLAYRKADFRLALSRRSPPNRLRTPDVAEFRTPLGLRPKSKPRR